MRTLFLILINIGLTLSISGQTQDRCFVGTKPFHDLQLSLDLEAYTTQWLKQPPLRSRSKITIPVVVHIVWNKEEDNISEEQIHSQIAALNRDFQLENDNLDIIPNAFENSIGNVGFEFCLASQDPEGNPTTGITRTETRIANVGTTADTIIFYTDLGGRDAWDTQKYLNIWVAEISDSSGILGYASRPGANKAEEDGVVVLPQNFGTLGTVEPPYHLGKTTTHEVGHYFNLLHLEGDDNTTSCEEGDMVADTPPQMTNYLGCPDIFTFSCGSLDLIANYMNWVDDACTALFTKGQVERMHAALNGARSGLLENTACLPTNISIPIASNFSIYPNPTTDYIYLKNNSQQLEEISYQIFDIRGRLKKEGTFQNNQELNRISLPFPKGTYVLKLTSKKEVMVKALLLF